MVITSYWLQCRVIPATGWLYASSGDADSLIERCSSPPARFLRIAPPWSFSGHAHPPGRREGPSFRGRRNLWEIFTSGSAKAMAGGHGHHDGPHRARRWARLRQISWRGFLHQPSHRRGRLLSQHRSSSTPVFVKRRDGGTPRPRLHVMGFGVPQLVLDRGEKRLVRLRSHRRPRHHAPAPGGLIVGMQAAEPILDLTSSGTANSRWAPSSSPHRWG